MSQYIEKMDDYNKALANLANHEPIVGGESPKFLGQNGEAISNRFRKGFQEGKGREGNRNCSLDRFFLFFLQTLPSKVL